MKKGLTTCAFADMLKEQSRAEQSRAEQSRAEQSRVSETLPVCGAPISGWVNNYCKKRRCSGVVKTMPGQRLFAF